MESLGSPPQEWSDMRQRRCLWFSTVHLFVRWLVNIEGVAKLHSVRLIENWTATEKHNACFRLICQNDHSGST